MNAPAISVIMPCYKGAALIGETIESLLAQSFDDWELVAVDDCSPDDTLAVLRRYHDPRIRVIAAEQNGGPVIARNLAFAHAQGRYIAALDQDDIALPTRFEQQAAYLDTHPETVLVSSAVDVLEQGRVVAGTWPRPLSPVMIDWMLRIRNPFAWSSVMFRADAARRLDPFERPEVRYAEDFDLYHRLRAFGPFAQIEVPLTLYRNHDGGVSKTAQDRMLASAAHVLTELHRERFGAFAGQAAMLLVQHVMARRPVPDAHSLARLFAVIGRLRADFAAEPGRRAADMAAIDRHISRLWWRICRAGVRSGCVPLRHALACRPSRISLREGQPADLMLSGVIGGVRALGSTLRS